MNGLSSALGWCVLFMVLCASACNNKKIRSVWVSESAPVIDGQNEEWEQSSVFFEDEELYVGIFNDSEHLYLAFFSEDAGLRRQVLARGLELWVTPQGSDHRLGIRFPLSLRGEPGLLDNPEDHRELEITIPRKNLTRRMPVREARGIEVKLGEQPGKVFYEIKIPLRETGETPYAAGAVDGKLDILLKTLPGGPGAGKSLSRSDGNRQDGSAMNRQGGRGGAMGMGGGRGGRGGKGGRGGGEAPARALKKPLELKITTQLANS